MLLVMDSVFRQGFAVMKYFTGIGKPAIKSIYHSAVSGIGLESTKRISGASNGGFTGRAIPKGFDTP
jgi:hypothetical protein